MSLDRPRARPLVVSALSDPGIYPHAVDRVELVETHISWVFLAGDRVYKVKKPVDLGFLDFTTLERRRHFCEEEVRLNRRLTHDVYLGVVELNGRDAIAFGGPGPTLDVAVMMRRLPHDRMLDELVRRGAAEPGLVEELGRIVARFHAAAPTGGEIDDLGSLSTVSANWAENFAQTTELPPEILPEEWRRTLRAWAQAFMRREASRFAARVAAGRIRDCHGDLQAQHVCCTEPVQIFDCIEFNHRFRYGDVAGEIAFLAMDLDRLGRSELAMRFLNAYLEASGDYEAVPLLDFYRAYRAFVRGKVLSFQIAERPEAATKARDRFALALRYTERRDPRRLLITTGVIGSGKSSVAREVAARLGAIVVRTDALRKHLAGLALSERRQAGFGEGLYGPRWGGGRTRRRWPWPRRSSTPAGRSSSTARFRRPPSGARRARLRPGPAPPSPCSGATRRTRCSPSGSDDVPTIPRKSPTRASTSCRSIGRDTSRRIARRT